MLRCYILSLTLGSWQRIVEVLFERGAYLWRWAIQTVIELARRIQWAQSQRYELINSNEFIHFYVTPTSFCEWRNFSTYSFLRGSFSHSLYIKQTHMDLTQFKDTRKNGCCMAVHFFKFIVALFLLVVALMKSSYFYSLFKSSLLPLFPSIFVSFHYSQHSEDMYWNCFYM